MKKILFVADFFSKDLSGGAESNDANLLKHLSLTNEIRISQSHKLSSQFVDDSDIVIVSNFFNVSQEGLRYIQDTKPYIIYEHDHKYVRNRDPSVYPNFVVPESEKVNTEFYKKAKKVFVLSKICKEVLEKNVPSTDVHSIGCSLWSEETFDYIESLLSEQKENDLCILKSGNPIKNYDKSLEYCIKNDIIPLELSEPIYRIFLKKMASCERMLFIPGVLETFSRVSAEAKMLGLKLMTTPKRLGFASEDIFEQSGVELINSFRDRNKRALEAFDRELEW
tara:strand:+ start:2732 stop:3571 length:840 start_codon:yes stop_codon:yes gene_type:complete